LGTTFSNKKQNLLALKDHHNMKDVFCKHVTKNGNSLIAINHMHCTTYISKDDWIAYTTRYPHHTFEEFNVTHE
jgi:hypothetical protein